MATVPAPRTWAASDLTTTIFNGTTGIKGPLDFLLNPPRCRLYQTATTSMPSGTATAILFDTEEDDTDSMHSTSTNTSRIVCNAAGLYQVIATLGFAGNATGYRRVDLRKNGGPTPFATVSVQAASSLSSAVQVVAKVPLAVGDYVEMYGTQNSGSALASVAGADWTKFEAQWVALS
jgi:hypothetical protein